MIQLPKNRIRRILLTAVAGGLFTMLFIGNFYSAIKNSIEEDRIRKTDYYTINTYTVVPPKFNDCDNVQVVINRTADNVDIRFNVRIEKQGTSKQFVDGRSIEIQKGFYNGTSTRTLSRPKGWFCLPVGRYKEVIVGYYTIKGIDKTYYVESEPFDII